MSKTTGKTVSHDFFPEKFLKIPEFSRKKINII